MAEPLKPLPDIEKLSDRVIRVLGGNPSKVSAIP
jgi:ribonuclease/clavin/mitogillin